MTERTNKGKHKRSLSLSKNKKKGGVKGGLCAKAATTTPISSFFSSQPSRVACPLCGQLVPKNTINQHIDLQCHNFERDHSAASVSHNVPNIPLSPTKTPPKSTEPEKDDMKTSPYFKKSNFHQLPQEMSSKSVIRTLDLGSLSSKLSKRCNLPERTENKHDEKETQISETLNSSQKENFLMEMESSGDNDVTETGSEELKSMSHLEKAHVLDPKASKSETFHNLVSSSSSPVKRKKKAQSTSRVYGFLKRARNDVSNKETQDSDLFTGSAAEMTDTDQCRGQVSSLCDPPFGGTSDEASGINTGTSAEKTTTDQQVEMSHPPWLPYYLRNFCTVVEAVLENEDDRTLFNEDDLSLVHTFEKLSVMGQKLYVRLFQRKLNWLQVNKLDYEEISSDLEPVAQELVECGFLQTESDLQDVAEALELLPAPELKVLAKTFHLSSSTTQKQQIVDGLLRLSKQKSLFSLTPGQNSISGVILKKAQQLAGSCVRLCRGPRAVFSRILLLFSLTDSVDEEEMASGGQGQLFTILLVKSGRLAFPDYQVQRTVKIFQDRADLIRYEAAMRALQELTLAMQAGQWEEALELYTAAKSAWEELRRNHNLRYQNELPVFLRGFTTGWVYTRVLSRGVEILQRLRRYEEAVQELQSLLLQSVYCPDSRGRWWDRLALNLHQHLKRPEQALRAIRDGLSDPLVRTGHKLSLHQRAVRMMDSASCKKYRLQLKSLPTIHIQDVKHVTIRGQLFPHEGGMGKSLFLIPASGVGGASPDTTVICSVEELSLEHYRKQGFDQGIHGEGSTFSALFALLLWDIIFMEGIPDVFRNLYQTCPLDLCTDCFYENRKEAIDSRVALISDASVETLHDMLENVWTSQEGKVCSLVNWERFSSLQQAQSLVSCFGGAFLGGVIARMAKDYRHCRGGLPDLVVWNTSSNSFKLVEVKGPNDRLSQKQQIWLDELQKLGADVEVCHVAATGARGARLD
ncbi:fanconi-associated nuclease 1 [Thalassophryne amazonica]|uniref:fanconi-associated nuclease 1 n=1 Tax=Thalassophryne amazonica TaxID=390379 RepID=UPI001471325F|nr:fanconi-associated nuclease 1 [Thalassophryne amazonica]